ncbi:hypothetical protein BU24DRAFT_458662 [Aaosphaeria arxii CBS 175.79]|uniref:Secreted protein n=1 Tax=Aaosphaeria arxii CBS 175.79 TaxID=1450172 RepID=A0A6A5Y2Y3_9PLEO|nr:uncharacterized protein BU24DRAFT_458662 [Aaosphaeria arxii CBS 175.79]KAF2018934.1 hypothetical protein BU24DRAFT_458662 [Aaosphaeria arxii CBS 175.79]
MATATAMVVVVMATSVSESSSSSWQDDDSTWQAADTEFVLCTIPSVLAVASDELSYALRRQHVKGAQVTRGPTVAQRNPNSYADTAFDFGHVAAGVAEFCSRPFHKSGFISRAAFGNDDDCHALPRSDIAVQEPWNNDAGVENISIPESFLQEQRPAIKRSTPDA